MASSVYAEFLPSHRDAPAVPRIGEVPDDENIELSFYLKPHDGESKAPRSRHELAAARQTDYQSEIAKIIAFAGAAGLHVVSVQAQRRLVKLSGDAKTVQQVFRTRLGRYQGDGQAFRGRAGKLSLPEDLIPIVEAVLGLDTRPAATTRIAYPDQNAAAGASFLPNQVAGFYDVPTDVTGAGECIALIELGGGFNVADTDAAFAAMGLTAPKVIAVDVDGSANKPEPDDGADGEVALDIQVAGGLAPGAQIAVYFTTNTDAGFVDAISTAAHDTANAPSVMSISWGSPESDYTAQSLAAMTSALQDAASLGVSVFVAAGDNLATDGVSDGKAHVDFPASSPWAIGCGGTYITVKSGQITQETVWNRGTSGTGGGISDSYPVPDFQASTALPASYNGGGKGRGVPDVACLADPNSGYVIVVSGAKEVVGGTSAAAPFWAGLTALINQKAGKPLGFFLPQLYAATTLARDITKGNNKPEGSPIGYDAGTGWDACTGLGVPDGSALIAALSSTATTDEPVA